MKLAVSHTQGLVPITILHVEGGVDGSNYTELIAKAQELYNGGVRYLLLDLSNLTFLSSAGFSALHRVSKLFLGASRAELEKGWPESRPTSRDKERHIRMQRHVKLLNPPEPVRETLNLIGFDHLFEIYADVNEAMSSFRQ
jgi:anti-anti-sigma regulatory factor